MFNHDHCRTIVDQGLEDHKERLHIQWMKSDRRLIEDKDGIALQFSHFARKL